MLYELCSSTVVHATRTKRGGSVHVTENDMYMNFLV